MRTRRPHRSAAQQPYPFFGAHQAGIVTPAQDRLHFAAFDVTTTRREDLVDLLTAWTAAAARMTQGQGAGTYGPVSGPYDAPPDDTGEALGLPPSGLTLTFGFGPTLFRDAQGRDRFGLAGQRPAALADLPQFPADDLDPARSGGDLCVQACAHDPQVAVHAIRNLARIAFGTAVVRWSQLGFGRTSSTSTAQDTPRNLFGFKDGTANVKAEDPNAADQVWVQPGDGPAVDDRRQLPGRPPDPDEHRDLGPDLAARAGERHRAHQGRGRPAVRRHRVHRARLHRDRPRRRSR